MSDLTEKLSVLDKMSDSIMKIVQAGKSMAEQFERTGNTAGTAFGYICVTAAAASSKVDGFAASMESLRGAADNAADSADTLAGVLGGSGGAAAVIEKSAVSAAELVRNEDAAAGSTAELARAGIEGAEAIYELAMAQDEAVRSTEAYDTIISSTAVSLKELEAAAKRAGHAAENLAESNGSAGSAAEDLSKAAENSGKKGIDAIVEVADKLENAGITAKVEEIAVAVYEMVAAFSEAESTIVKATGTSGEALDELTDSMLDAFAASRFGSLEDTAAAVGEINTRMGYTGDRLTTVTGQFLDFSEITGTNVVRSVQNATKIMNRWGIEQSEVVSVLDKLAYAGQISGGSVDNLSNILIRNATVFRSLGLDLDNTIGLLANLEIYGMTAQTVITGLRTAINNFGKDGLDAGTAVRDVISEINNMEDEGEAKALAVETFGSIVGGEFVAAIRSGEISVDGLSQSLDAAQGTLTATAKTSQTLDQKWTQASNNISTAFTKTVQPTVDGVSGGLAIMANSFGDFLNKHPIVAQKITEIGASIGCLVIAFAAVSAAVGIYKAVMLVAEGVTTLFGVSLSTAIWPITLVVAGITAVVAIVAALVDHYNAAEDETAGMTAATRAQYYELQNLNEEYDKACEKHGETSREALELKYQVDELTEAYNADRQTMEEFIAEVDALCESVSQVTSDFDDNMAAIKNTEMGTLALIQKYEDLASQAELSRAQEKELEAITEKLSKTYPDLAARMDSATLSTEDYVEAMKKACEQEAEEQRQAQARKTYTDALQKQEELTEEIAKAQKNLNLEQARMDDMSGWEHLWTVHEWDNFEECQAALDELYEKQRENNATIAKTEQYWADMAAAEQAAAEETLSWQDAATAAYEDVKDRVIELCEAYGEAYNAALDSFEGQFGLFDKADMESENYMKSTVENAQKALDSQLAYWDSYLANIEALKNTSAEDLGIKQEDYEALMAYVQDGSEQAAGLAASMTEALGRGDTETVAALANTVGEVNARKQEIAAATADWITNFSSEMDEIEQEMQSAVEGMNLDDEAAKSARETIDAYADSIRAGKANAVSAAEEVADAVLAAFYSAEASVNASVNSDGGSGYPNGTANAESPYFAEESAPKPSWGPKAIGIDGTMDGITESAISGTTDSTDSSVAEENGPKPIVGEQGGLAFPVVETGRFLPAMNGNRGQSWAASAFNEGKFPAIGGGAVPAYDGRAFPAYSGGTFPAFNEGALPAYSGRTFPAFDRGTLPALSEAAAPAPGKGGRGEQDKNLYIHIGGSEPIEVKGGRANREEIVEVLGKHLKPMLMNMIQGEVYEEGDYSYGY